MRWKGKPAGILRQTGSGQIWLFGTCMGTNATAHIENDSLECIRKLLALCGIHPNHAGKLLLQKRQAGHREAWVITNPEKENLTESFSIPQNAKVTELLGDGIKTDGNTVELAVAPLDVRVLVVEGKND